MAAGKEFYGKPQDGKPRLWFDDGNIALVATLRRGVLLYTAKIRDWVIRGVAAFLAAALPPTCFAEAVYDETTGFVTLLKDDRSNRNGGHSLTSAGNWSDLLPPHNDPPTNYYVKSGWYAYADDGDLEFPAPLYVAGTIVPRSGSKQSATFADLKMLEGGRISYSLLYNLHGNIEILATDESNPAAISYARSSSNGIKIFANLSGANQFQSEDDLSVDPDLDQTAMWTDGRFPHPDCDYYLGSSTNIAFRAANATHPNRVTTFPGGALVMGDLSVIYLYGVDVCISNLHAYGRGIVYQRGSSASLSGKLTLHKYSDAKNFVARVFQDAQLHIESDISGDGGMNANNYYPSNNGGTLYLDGMNTNWTGKLVSSWTKDAASPDVSETAHMHVVVGDGRSLGGGNATFLHDAVTLKDYTEIRVTNTTAFAEANRGFLVSENGCLNIDDSMTATLRKIGGGTLALGGKLRFGLNDDDEDATAPTDGRNAILVQSGALKVVGADALDGAVLTFSEGTSLHLDLRPGNGPCNVQDAWPLHEHTVVKPSARPTISEPITVRKGMQDEEWSHVRRSRVCRCDGVKDSAGLKAVGIWRGS